MKGMNIRMINKEVSLLGKEHKAIMKTYILDGKISTGIYKKRPAVIICPGGSYLFTSTREGEPVATRFLSLGYHAFVLRYTTYFKEKITEVDRIPEKNRVSYPDPLLELMTAILYIREHADEWYVDADNIFILGFSAGAHLAGTLAERWNDEELYQILKQQIGFNANGLNRKEWMKPRGVLLSYPLLNVETLIENMAKSNEPLMRVQEKYIKNAFIGEQKQQLPEQLNLIEHVNRDMPPVFLWHTCDDRVTSGKESAEFIYQLMNEEVPCEFHLYAKGEHGMALGDEYSASSEKNIDQECATWVNLANNWMRLIMRS